MAPVIKAENLFKRYPGFAPVLRGASIEVEPGEMVAIMGPSGCGKSTMLHILGMLHAPDSGSLEILGVNVLGLNREETAAFRRGNMGFVMQASNLFEHSTVFENVEFPLIYENVPPQERWERVIRALDLVRLSARVHYPSNRLSGGEQQRVAIARAMVNNPRILLADEPTGALDARTSRLIMENFRTLCHAGGVSMVMVTHDPKMAEYCDTIYTLEEGQLNCKKRGVGPFAEKSGDNFLNAPEPSVYGALVTSYFPDARDPDLLELARRLYSRGMLARIYAIFHHGLWEDSGDYALPLAIRHMGFWTRLMGLRMFFKRAKSSESLWSLWKHLPARGRLFRKLTAFAGGTLLARWGLQDAIQFFYAVGAGTPATAAWVGARLLRLPFAFEILASDIGHYSPDWRLKAQAATFIVCSTGAMLHEARKLLPDIPGDKFVFLANPPVVMPSEEEAEPSAPGGKKLLELLVMGPEVSPKGFETAMQACASLKKANIDFRLSIFSGGGWRQKRMARRLGLQREVAFLGLPSLENMGENYKLANIFIAFPPLGDGAGLTVPLYVREAMIFGLAIAAAGMTLGMGEILLNGTNCLECAAGDAEALAANLKKLAEDGAMRAQLGANARKAMENLASEGRQPLLPDLMAQAVGENTRQKVLNGAGA